LTLAGWRVVVVVVVAAAASFYDIWSLCLSVLPRFLFNDFFFFCCSFLAGLV